MTKTIRNIVVVVLMTSCLTGSLRLNGQTLSTADQVKAVFIFNFTQFVDWPSRSFSDNTSPFVIGILGDDPFGPYLESVVKGERFGSHPIVVQRFKTIKEITACHILFINNADPSTAIKELQNKSILTVGDQTHFADWGGMIRFFIQNNKIRLQINLKAAKAANLTISSKLLRVADVME